ncbi:MAG: DUF3333 domain-containing protein, partial [Pseudomonadota bacterium]
MAAIDFTELSAKHTSDATRRRLRARYWAEIRLKAYGIAAIAFAAGALLLLGSTIVTKTASVVYEYYLQLEADIEVGERDLERITSGNPNLRANLRGLVGSALTDAVGGAVDRRDSRALTGIVSSNAGLELGDVVKADSSLIGERVTFDALLDDNTQLYLKGSYGRLQPLDSNSEAVVALPGEDGAPVVVEVGPSAVGGIFDKLREQRLFDAGRARAEQARQQNAIDVTIEQLAVEEDPQLTERLERRLDAYRAARDRAEEQAQDLMRMATVRREITFEMSEEDSTLFLKMGGGWLKAETVERGRVTGILLEPVAAGTYAPGEWEALMMERPEAQRPINDR